MKTRITELLGSRYPIIQGGMQWVGRAELTSAVCNAGGFGVLTALTQPTPEALAQEIGRCREMTDQPFGVNLTILPTAKPPPYEAYLDAALDSGIKVIETAGNNPVEFIAKIKAHDAKIIHKCTAVRHALSAERKGADAISIDGFECAGHPGEDGIGSMVLFALAVQKVKVPLIASGAMSNGRTMAAALALGLDGINMGTRWCATREAPIHEHIKQLLVNASERDTNLIFRTLHNTARVLKTPVSDEVIAIENRPGGCEFKDIHHLVAGAKGREALESGDETRGIIWAGQSVGFIKDIPTCAELIERTVHECEECLAAAQHKMAANGCRRRPFHNSNTITS